MIKHNWEEIDWRRQDIEIAADLGVSREAVRKHRPIGVKALRHRKKTLTAEVMLSSMETSGLTLLEISKLAGCSVNHACSLLTKMGKTYRHLPRGRAKYEWDKFPSDWKGLTDKQIADMMDVSSAAMVAQWRRRHRMMRRVNKVESLVKESKVL